MNWIISVLLGVIIAGGAAIYFTPSELQPPVLRDVYWGPGKDPQKIDETIKPFTIKFTDEMIADLKGRLKNTRKMQSSLENTGWTYGVSGEYMPTFLDFWLNKYDFKKQEEHLNKYPQFTTTIQGLDIHFIHVKPNLPKDRELQVLPLLMVHGWPGSTVEFYKIIPLLITPRANVDYVFEVIAPSLPGFGFSSAAAKPGLGALQMSHVLKNLMLRLGYEKYYVHGGDWGSMVTSYMSSVYPEHVIGLHSNLCMSVNPSSLIKHAVYNLIPWLTTEKEREMMLPLFQQLSILIEETGYYHIQATRPDTIGNAFTDSPAGLASYIIEKFAFATKYNNKYSNDGNLLKSYTMEELIDNLMMYWVPNKASSAMRIYAESTNLKAFKLRMDSIPVKVPSACVQFPHEIINQPDEVIRDRYVNLVRVTKMSRGGHFAAMEEPELLADDIWTSVPLMIEMAEILRHKKSCY